MRNIEIPEKLPSQVQSVGEIIANKVPIKATCLRCELQTKVDLKTIVESLGPAYSLIDKSGLCRALACDGKVYFSVLPTGHDDWLPLLSRHFIRTGDPFWGTQTLK